MVAVRDTHLKVIQYLVDKGANVNATDKNGWTVLGLAKYMAIVKILLKAGAK